MGESGFFSIAIIIVIVVFLAMGGGFKPGAGSSASSTSAGFRSAIFTSSGAGQGSVRSSLSARENTPLPSGTSPYSGKIRLSPGYHYARDVKEQYVRIDTTYQLKEPVSISGWRLYSPKTGKGVTIGFGTELPQPSLGASGGEKIMLNPGDHANVISGRSPEGVSFRDNKCTGYFAANQRFYPAVSGSCPKPRDIPQRSVSNPNGLDDACLDYVHSLPYCSIVPAVPQRYAGSCADYIGEHFSYSGCVSDFRNDPGFFSNHWFVYLNQNEPLWTPSHDTIVLYDQDGKLVDSFTY